MKWDVSKEDHLVLTQEELDTVWEILMFMGAVSDLLTDEQKLQTLLIANKLVPFVSTDDPDAQIAVTIQEENE